MVRNSTAETMYRPALLFFLTTAIFPALLHAGSTQVPMPAQIEAFTNSRYPITNATKINVPIQIHDLDAPARLEEKLSASLSSDPKQAKTVAPKHLETLGADRLAEMVNQAYEGTTQAINHELVKIPAVVFDNGTSVIYGITDIDDAVARYQAWRQSEVQ
ncbi:MAG: TIGR03757 family integrating conjugative element protein [endosymbiont of Seepiophila jonesi]|uniref:TIGR03757 family integrating conjugative element protein n=1 Tax=endosymbiont of Lamellibrachia luymesi TaxID=2200907 RepID=A0A370DSI5_9GAMM|nr:MAG: TIGR03757 family integrating conjugative element protein [endosymbiont of Lamellibrachia luymesi]RDH93996.1 MAG: TIGR03757 family integrating conjugative element protein [endosymbiont of Seepiophila jonesi]